MLRIRSKEGMSRIQVESNETFVSLAQKVADTLKIEDFTTIAMSKDPNPSTAATLDQIGDKTIEAAGLKYSLIFIQLHK